MRSVFFREKRELRWFEAVPFILTLGPTETFVIDEYKITALILIGVAAAIYYFLVSRSTWSIVMALVLLALAVYSR